MIQFLFDRFLALVCLLRDDVFERQGLIEYNFHCFREAIQEVSQLTDESESVNYNVLRHCRSSV